MPHTAPDELDAVAAALNGRPKRRWDGEHRALDHLLAKAQDACGEHRLRPPNTCIFATPSGWVIDFYSKLRERRKLRLPYSTDCKIDNIGLCARQSVVPVG